MIHHTIRPIPAPWKQPSVPEHANAVVSGGEVGLLICRFWPDGRVFVVGGWDHRLLIVGQTVSKPLAILCSHEKSVTALDWAVRSATSGLLATGASDGRICIWRVFPHSLKGWIVMHQLLEHSVIKLWILPDSFQSLGFELTSDNGCRKAWNSRCWTSKSIA